MRDRLFVLVAVGVLLFAGVAAIQSGWSASVEDSGIEQSVTNESWTVDVGSPVALNESNRNDVVYDDEVTVYNASDELTVADGNYTWYDGNGTIEALSGSSMLSNNTTAKISYGFSEETSDQSAVATLALLPLGLGDVLLIALFAGVVIGAMVVLGRSG